MYKYKYVTFTPETMDRVLSQYISHGWKVISVSFSWTSATLERKVQHVGTANETA